MYRDIADMMEMMESVDSQESADTADKMVLMVYQDSAECQAIVGSAHQGLVV